MFRLFGSRSYFLVLSGLGLSSLPLHFLVKAWGLIHDGLQGLKIHIGAGLWIPKLKGLSSFLHTAGFYTTPKPKSPKPVFGTCLVGSCFG